MRYNLFFIILISAMLTQISCTKPAIYSKTNEPIDSLVVFMPNSFTPNNDNQNDDYSPVYAFGSYKADSPIVFVKARLNPIKFYEMEIMDEENKTVFYSKNINEAWDGKAFGKVLPIGKYNAFIHIEGRIKGIKNINVEFLLIR